MKIITILLALFLSTSLFAQKLGFPEIRNYSHTDYGAYSQNWAITQDNRGIMYIGNSDGVLEYDGATWRLIKLPNESVVRSLTVSYNNIIYVGGIGEFGYLHADGFGGISYKSLSADLDTSYNFNIDVWKTYTIDDDVYFCTFTHIYHYKNLQLINVIELEPRSSFFAFLVDDKLYVGDYFKGLTQIIDGKQSPMPNGEFFAEKNIFSIYKYNDSKLAVVTGRSGVWQYDISTNKITPLFRTELEGFVNENNLYSTMYQSPFHCFGSLDRGAQIIDTDHQTKYTIDNSKGLQDQTVISMNQPAKGQPLWLALNNGISKVYTDFPFTILGEKEGLNGRIMNVKWFNNKLFVATSVGVYVLNKDENNNQVFKRIPEIQNQAWSLLEYKVVETGETLLLAGTIEGLFEINKDLNVREIKKHDNNEATSIYTLSLTQSNNGADLYVGESNGIIVMDYDGRNWEIKKRVRLQNEIRDIVEISPNELWLATYLNGLIRLNLETDNFKQYGKDNGLKGEKALQPLEFNNKVYFYGEGGIYQYHSQNDRFEQAEIFGKRFNSNTYVESVNQINDNFIVHYRQNSKRKLALFTLNDKGLIEKKSPYAYFDDLIIENIEIYDNEAIISVGSAIYFHQFDSDFNYEAPFKAMVRNVSIQEDSTIFNGTFYTETDSMKLPSDKQTSDITYKLPYEQHNLTFSVAAGYYFDESKTKFSYYLEGNDTRWSSWNTETKVVKNNLREGNYVFKVKAKNVFGVESEVGTYTFAIAPPWYRSVVAYFLYIIAIVFLIWFIVRWNTRRLLQEKIRLEKIVEERTREVIEQRDQIAAQKKEITDSIEYASRIQRAVLPSSEKADELLRDHFILFRPRDIVSGDFYWMTNKDNKTVVVAADCTGHGVPGAFMSMLGVSFLNEIVNKKDVSQANFILNELRTDIKTMLQQEGKANESKDGMDVALCIIDYKHMKLQYSGAYNPLFLIRNGELIVTKADRNPIGIYIRELDSFTNHEIDLHEGDTIYIFSDGYLDQFGDGDKGKFKTKQFKELLASIQEEDMTTQKEILENTINEWMGNHAQIDDILVLGIRI